MGVDAVPTGSALATSDTVDVSTISDSVYEWVDFTFSTPYTLPDSGVFCIVLHYEGDGSNHVRWASGLNSHDGNRFWGDDAGGGWTANTQYDQLFKLYEAIESSSESASASASEGP